jgi:hypothetical protein
VAFEEAPSRAPSRAGAVSAERRGPDPGPRRSPIAWSSHNPVYGRAARGAWLRPLTLAALAATLALGLLAPASASAAFSQPFTCQIKGGAGGTPSGFEPLGVVADAAGNLWVGEFPDALSEFSSSCGFLGPEPGPAPLQLKGSSHEYTLNGNKLTPGSVVPQNLSIDHLSGAFYVTGNLTRNNFDPKYVEVFNGTGALQPWSQSETGFETPHVVVDNSTESVKDPSACGSFPLSPSECFVYVSHATTGRLAFPGGIEKFSASGAPVSFAGCGTCSSYVTGNSITGTSTGRAFASGPNDVTVDSFGNIYVITNVAHEYLGVAEYKPSGEFVRFFTGEETPGLGGSHEEGGWGARVEGIAVSPVSGLLAVSVNRGGYGEPIFRGAVDEFDPSSGVFISQITEASPGKPLEGAKEMAYDAHGNLFVVDQHENTVDVFSGPGQFLPAFRLADAGGRTPVGAVLNGWVNPESGVDPEHPSPGLSDCHFEFVGAEAFRQAGFSGSSVAPCVPGAGAIAGEAWTAVHADVSGLLPGGTYYYRVVASIPGGFGGTGYSEPLAFTTPHAPRVDSISASNLSSTFADLRAQIDPLGADSTYSFQYVDEADFNATGYASARATPEVDIGSGGPTGGADAGVVAQVGGLSPATTYHFRVLAANKYGLAGEREATFTTLPQVAPGLPDGRAYELVTPPNKGGAADMFAAPSSSNEFSNPDVGFPSDSGDGFLLRTKAAFGPFPASFGNVYVFARTAGGWAYSSLASPSLGVQSILAPVVNPDFSRVAFTDAAGAPVSEAGAHPVSLLGPPGGPYSTIFSDPAQLHNALESLPETVVGASHDLSHVVIEGRSHALAAGAGSQDPGSGALYESEGAGECGGESSNCKLVDVTPEGSVFKCGGVLGQETARGKAHNAVSSDGSRVLFTAPDPSMSPSVGGPGGPGCWGGKASPQTNPPQLYMRSGGETVEVSAPESGVSDPTGLHPVVYVGASEDGSKVFFLSEAWLTENHPEGHDKELYECEIVQEAEKTRCRLTRISAGEAGSPGAKAGAGLDTVPAVSAEGTAVYFTAFGALAHGASELKPSPGGGEAPVNLYRYDTASGASSYVATVGTGDYPSNEIATWIGSAGFPSSVALSTDANWYTTPDGRYLLFGTTRELTGYSTLNAGNFCLLPGSQGAHNGHCAELYRYDSAGGGPPVCVSCDPSGVPPVSDAEFTRSPESSWAAGAVRAMSDDGSYVFFDTADALVPEDGNGTLDVYEWHEGRVSLISSGQDPAPSFFLGTSADAANVFFGTHARLVAQDTDTNGDIYDARVCLPEAGDPCIKPPSGGTAQCEGDACQSPPAALIDATPVSLTFAGAGNLAPPPPKKVTNKTVKCKKGLVKKKVKKRQTCVKKPKPKKRRTRGKRARQAVKHNRGGSK